MSSEAGIGSLIVEVVAGTADEVVEDPGIEVVVVS